MFWAGSAEQAVCTKPIFTMASEERRAMFAYFLVGLRVEGVNTWVLPREDWARPGV